MKLTSKTNGKYIFLPFAGYKSSAYGLQNVGTAAKLVLSSTYNGSYAYLIALYKSGNLSNSYDYDYDYSSNSFSVRAVTLIE